MNLISALLNDAIAMTLILVLLTHSAIIRARGGLRHQQILSMLLIIGASILLDMGSVLLDGRTFPGARILSLAVNTLLHMSPMLFLLIFCRYVHYRLYADRTRLRNVSRKLVVLCVLAALILALNLFVPVIFSLDASGHYRGGPAHFLHYLSMLLTAGVSIFFYVRFRMAGGTVRFFPFWNCVLPMVLGILVQTGFLGTSAMWCGAAVGMAGLYMGLQNELSYLDPLTSLYNRNYLRLLLQLAAKEKSEMGGIMIDMDGMKLINDQFGHAQGDRALCDVADLLRAIRPPDCHAIRLGGDEFMLLLPRCNTSMLLGMEYRLRERLADFNRVSTRVYELSLSLGHAVFKPDRESADDFLRSVDGQMYEEKKKKHAREAQGGIHGVPQASPP